MLLNLMLLALSAAGAFVAIGGDTWNKEAPSLASKLTRTGWVATMLISATLILASVKEIKQSGATQRQQDRITRLLDSNNELSQMLAETRSISEKAAMDSEAARLEAEIQSYNDAMKKWNEQHADGWATADESTRNWILRNRPSLSDEAIQHASARGRQIYIGAEPSRLYDSRD